MNADMSKDPLRNPHEVKAPENIYAFVVACAEFSQPSASTPLKLVKEKLEAYNDLFHDLSFDVHVVSNVEGHDDLKDKLEAPEALKSYILSELNEKKNTTVIMLFLSDGVKLVEETGLCMKSKHSGIWTNVLGVSDIQYLLRSSGAENILLVLEACECVVEADGYGFLEQRSWRLSEEGLKGLYVLTSTSLDQKDQEKSLFSDVVIKNSRDQDDRVTASLFVQQVCKLVPGSSNWTMPGSLDFALSWNEYDILSYYLTREFVDQCRGVHQEERKQEVMSQSMLTTSQKKKVKKNQKKLLEQEEDGTSAKVIQLGSVDKKESVIEENAEQTYTTGLSKSQKKRLKKKQKKACEAQIVNDDMDKKAGEAEVKMKAEEEARIQENLEEVRKNCLDLGTLPTIVSDLRGLQELVKDIKRDLTSKKKRLTKETIKKVNELADQMIEKVRLMLEAKKQPFDLVRLNYLSHLQCLVTLTLPSNHSVRPVMLASTLLCLMGLSIAQLNPECGIRALHYLFRNSVKLISDSLLYPCGFLLHTYGNILFDQSKYDEALEHYHRALELKEKLNPNSMDVASSLGNIGNILYKQSKYDEALEHYHRALELFEKLNPNSMDVANSLGNIGSVLSDQSKYDEALKHLHRALKLQEKLNPNSMDVANSLNNIGNILSEQSKYNEALEHYRRALELQEKLNPNSMDVASSLGNIGNILSKQSKYDDALDHYYKSLQKSKYPHDQIEPLTGCLEIFLTCPLMSSKNPEMYKTVVKPCDHLIDLTWKETDKEQNPGKMFNYLNFVKIVHYLAVMHSRQGNEEKAKHLLLEASDGFGKVGLVHLQLRMAEEAYSVMKSASSKDDQCQIAAKCAKLCESPEIDDILGDLQWSTVKYEHEKTDENKKHVHELFSRLIPFQNGSGNSALIAQVHECRHLWHSAQMEIFDSFMSSRKDSLNVSERARNMVCSILVTLLSTLDQAFGDLVRHRLGMKPAVDLYFAPSFALRRDFEANFYRYCIMQHLPTNLPTAWNKWLISKKLLLKLSSGCSTYKLSKDINSKPDLEQKLSKSALPLNSIVLDVIAESFDFSDEDQSVDSEEFSKKLNKALWVHIENICKQNPKWFKPHETWHPDYTVYVDRGLETLTDQELDKESDPELMKWFRNQCKDKFSEESLDGDHGDIYKAICNVQPWRLFAADNIKEQSPDIDWRSSWWCELYDTANETKHVRIVPQTAATELKRKKGLTEKLDCSLSLSYSELSLRPWSFAHAFMPVSDALWERDWNGNIVSGIPAESQKETEDVSRSFELSRLIVHKLSECKKLEKRGPSRDWLLTLLDDRSDEEKKKTPFKFEMTPKNIFLLAGEIKSMVGSEIQDPLLTEGAFYGIARILMRHAIFRFHRQSSLDRQMDLQLFVERCLNGTQYVVEKMMNTNVSSSCDELSDQCLQAISAVKDPNISHIPNDITIDKARDRMLNSNAHPSDVVCYIDICLKTSHNDAPKDAVDMLMKESNLLPEQMEWLSLYLLERAYELCHWHEWENAEVKRLELVQCVVKRTKDLSMHSRARSFFAPVVDIHYSDWKEINVGTLHKMFGLEDSNVIENLTINDLLGQLDSAYEEMYHFRLKLIDAERVRAAAGGQEETIVQVMNSVVTVQLSSLLTKIRHLLDQALGAALMHHIYQHDSSLEPRDSKNRQIVNAMSQIYFPPRDAEKYLKDQGHDTGNSFHLPESLVNLVTEYQGKNWMKDLINLNNHQKHVSASALEETKLDNIEDPLDLLAAKMKQPLPISSSFKEIFETSKCSNSDELSEKLFELLTKLNIISTKMSPDKGQEKLKKQLEGMVNTGNDLKKRLLGKTDKKFSALREYLDDEQTCNIIYAKLKSFGNDKEKIAIPIIQLLRESLDGTRAFVVAVCKSFGTTNSSV